jgi:hypothetical protein
MNPDSVPSENNTENVPVSLPIPFAWWGRVLYGLFVTVMPVIAFGGIDALKPEWQNGKFESYLILFLFPEASLPFLVLLTYSVICYLFLLVAPVRFSRFFLVRFGIYTGVLLALQYSIITLIWSFASSASSTNLILPIWIWISPFIFVFLYRLALKRWSPDKVNKSLSILILAGILITIFWNRSDLFLLVLMGLTLASPFWSFLISLRAAIWLFKNHETKFALPHGLGLVAWLSAYVAAWRFDILKMYELYAALPPQPPPDCYIATAAAHGHPQFVHSWVVEGGDWKSTRVNEQLQILKCVELALSATHPHLHKRLRKLYDVIGKSLARRIRNPFIADVAYLFLKPFEWMARGILRTIIHEIDVIARSIYVNSSALKVCR